MSEEAAKHDAGVENEPVEQEQGKPEPKMFDEAYVKELREEAAKYRVKLKEFEDRDKTEAEKTAERIAQLEQENASFKREADRLNWVRDAAREVGLPIEALEVIQGESYDEILSGANRIKSLIPEVRTVIPGAAEREALPLNGDGIEAALRKALGG